MIRVDGRRYRNWVLVCAGHGLYQCGEWHGVPTAGDESALEDHLRYAYRLAHRLRVRALVLSGGHTRPHVPAVREGRVTNSEAAGMHAWATEYGLDPGNADVLLEPYARDSFENVFFALLAYHRRYFEWPRGVGVVSWTFKAARFAIIAEGLGIGRFRFFGSGQASNAAVCAHEIKNSSTIVGSGDPSGLVFDPLHRAQRFGDKRARRTPPALADRYLGAVKAAYDVASSVGAAGPIADVLDRVECLAPGPGWRDIQWPWQEKLVTR
jgi:hypothetical protein